jgi:hypothetical protein
MIRYLRRNRSIVENIFMGQVLNESCCLQAEILNHSIFEYAFPTISESALTAPKF